MRLGAIFPQTEIGADPSAVKDFAQAAEDLGYDHILVFDHVLGADASKRETWGRPYDKDDMFHEPFVMFGYLGAITEKIEFTTGVLILGQRQTGLVAKQAAEVDVLTGGRLRLGIGIGWNDVEYEALGQSFTNRGRRSEEQIDLLRQLWTQEVVDFHGKYHDVTNAGINPLPVQRPIPIWLGGGESRVIQRIGKMADGWFPQFQPDSAGQEKLHEMREAATKAGRNPKDIGIEGRIALATDKQEDWEKMAAAWDEVDATHLSFNTMKAGLKGPDQHIEAIKRFKETISG
ncbi:MAG: LLM class F420-dependent oxidoreductase [SAR202 cluster bacterium]|nr:LLM class F420-dependent oxidoreductase [Chloroflexota bacterium]MQF94264.1 LLM class F420-dependent oxidoreductase [SAR202 cluster bacterium]HAA95334.1 LLM class F420-dependent oxidoreductase [Dehalococcoidia bacterium]MQG34404.1 LLM class F420-dependent oxidoreductase [SAR202 cluster bacterium]HCL25673.1 LLM class F420-dependent oxidoreductase [Dehalococcoidia bacterium]|tara:strand:- start:1484 stop:2350 length:867 start_codon:yes stop_codon:yes gene_type:complete